MNWIPFALTSAVFYSLSNAFTKIYQAKLGNGFGSIIFTIGALFGSVAIAFFLRSTLPAKSGGGIAIALISGLLWAVANVLFLTTLGKNAPLSIAMPLVVGSIGVGGVLAGVFMFGEQLTVMRIIGIIFVLIGTVVLSRS